MNYSAPTPHRIVTLHHLPVRLQVSLAPISAQAMGGEKHVIMTSYFGEASVHLVGRMRCAEFSVRNACAVSVGGIGRGPNMCWKDARNATGGGGGGVGEFATATGSAGATGRASSC